MPTLCRFYGIQIRMYFDAEHGPHFHAVYGNITAQISILNGEVLSGKLPPRVHRLVLEWANLHHDELLENWQRARHGQSFVKIAPLE